MFADKTHPRYLFEKLKCSVAQVERVVPARRERLHEPCQFQTDLRLDSCQEPGKGRPVRGPRIQGVHSSLDEQRPDRWLQPGEQHPHATLAPSGRIGGPVDGVNPDQARQIGPERSARRSKILATVELPAIGQSTCEKAVGPIDKAAPASTGIGDINDFAQLEVRE
jgi:hypothetical protein